MEYLAHSENECGRTDSMTFHLGGVADLAATYAQHFNAAREARLAGLLHDLGKYGVLFQDRLQGKAKRIDHWSLGAWAALKSYQEKGIAAALVIQGHHLGLQSGTASALKSIQPKTLQQNHPLNLRLSELDLNVLLSRFKDDGLELPASSDLPASLYGGLGGSNACSAMLDVRMLFSALVDADFIDTEAHFNAGEGESRRYRKEGLPLNSKYALSILLGHLEEIAERSPASAHVNLLRKDLLGACLDAAAFPQGVFALTAPTGTGKTLSSLAFALKHAVEHGLRRIVYVIPYLSIIEQTVEVYRKAFASCFSAEDLRRYILEHHSLAGSRERSKELSSGELDAETQEKYQARILSENWDAPIVVTTSVQMLESLFSNRPSACRKLHRLAKSVILFDEVQTLPVRLAIPTLATLSHLVERYGATVVFSTATQPAFSQLQDKMKEFSNYGWKPQEIVPSHLNLFGRAKRTRVNWRDRPVSWDELAKELASKDRALCIVNLKRHALHLHAILKDMGIEDVFHLSTNMCAAHRTAVLDTVRDRLDSGKPCRLVSTQCIEAGVDVDFPVVYRAFGPLEAVTQAAGRCNRKGLLDCGAVHVFIPSEERYPYPDRTYGQAADVTGLLLKEYGALDPDDADIFRVYYAKFFDFAKPENRNPELREAIKSQGFIETANLYRLIDKDTWNVLVPYDLNAYRALAHEARSSGLSGAWIAKARPHSIGIFRPRRNASVLQWLEAVPLKKGGKASDDWWIYLKEDHYNADTGLVPPELMESLIG